MKVVMLAGLKSNGKQTLLLLNNILSFIIMLVLKISGLMLNVRSKQMDRVLLVGGF